MTDKYDDIRANVMQLLTAAGITYSVRYVGETERTQGGSDKPWKCDAWRFTFKAPSARQSTDRTAGNEYSGDYFTGLGHRKPPAFPKPNPPYRPGTLAHENYQKTFKTVAPHAADILHSLLLDAGAEGSNFRDWANDFGYSDDSISALETYRQCCNIGAALRRIFDHKTLEALRTATEEL